MMLVHFLFLSLLLPLSFIHGAFVHPGLFHTEADFARMRAMVNASQEPWISGWTRLTSSGFAQLGIVPWTPVNVTRPGNIWSMASGAAIAYQTALRWKITGDERYANASIRFLDAFSLNTKSLAGVPGNYDYILAAGIQGYQFANAAEIMRTYPKWGNFSIFQKWMLDIFYPINDPSLTYLPVEPSRRDTVVWANWDLCNMAALLSIGVLTDRQDIFDKAIQYALHGPGNGAFYRAVFYLHDGNLGQWQESGRDQGHTSLGIALISPFLQAAWNQGVDLYSYDNYRFLAGMEYIVKTNTWNNETMDWYGSTIPFVAYHHAFPWDDQQQTMVAGPGGFVRPCLETMYNHYVNRLGMWAPFTTQMVAKFRPEGDGGGGDQLGHGTLTMSLPPPAVGATPIVSVRLHGGNVVVNWFGSCYASYYNIYRSNNNITWIRIVYNQSGLSTTYKDTLQGLSRGGYYYRVTGIIDKTGEETSTSNIASISTSPILKAQYLLTNTLPLNPILSNVLYFNHTSLSYRNYTLNNTINIMESIQGYHGITAGGHIAFVNDNRFNNSVRFHGVADEYVRIPVAPILSTLSDFSICIWVKLYTSNQFSRIFDFGENGQERYMFFMVTQNTVRYTITRFWAPAEQTIVVSRNIPLNTWSHYCITQRGRVGYVYINGTAYGAGIKFDFQPFRLGYGNTSNMYLGKSQYPNDPYLNAQLYDLRVYHGDLGPAAVYEMATGQQAGQPPQPPTSINGTQSLSNVTTISGNDTIVTFTFTNTLSWNVVPNATYTVMRSTACGPYEMIATILTSPTYQDIVNNGTYYQYQINSRNQAGDGMTSQTLTVIPLWKGDYTPKCITLPTTAPTTTAPTSTGTATATPTTVAPVPKEPTTASPTTPSPTSTTTTATAAPTTGAPTTSTPTPTPTIPANTTDTKISEAYHVNMSRVIIVFACVIGSMLY